MRRRMAFDAKVNIHFLSVDRLETWNSVIFVEGEVAKWNVEEGDVRYISKKYLLIEGDQTWRKMGEEQNCRNLATQIFLVI